jgi:hypothetical protein
MIEQLYSDESLDPVYQCECGHIDTKLNRKGDDAFCPNCDRLLIRDAIETINYKYSIN